MTAFNYAHTALTASRLLQQFGAPCVLRRMTGEAYDPNTGTNTPTYADTPSTAAVFPMPQKYVNGTDILQGDMTALIVPATEPKQGDKLAWGGKDWTVVNVKPVAPAGVNVLFEAQVRGA